MENGAQVDKRIDEATRWPTHLTHGEIVLRLVRFRGDARARDLPDLAERFAEVEGMSPMQIASRVVATISWLEDKPEHRGLASQLELVAMNLKNLKNPD
jgi:hypothetical protein